MMIPNMVIPLKNVDTATTVNIRFLKSERGRSGSGARVSIKRNISSIAAPKTSGTTTWGEPHGYCCPARETPSINGSSPPISAAAPQ